MKMDLTGLALNLTLWPVKAKAAESGTKYSGQQYLQTSAGMKKLVQVCKYVQH